MIVYTSIYGEYDQPKPICPHPDVTDWILYTDSVVTFNLAKQAGWRAVFESRHEFDEPRMQAKWRKCHPPTEAATSLYIDGSIRLRSSAPIDTATAVMRDSDWAMYCHAECDNLVDQIALCVTKSKYAGLIETMREQLAHYVKERACSSSQLNFPWAGGIIARNHTRPVLDAGHAWWSECVRWTYQDQIALPVILARHKINTAVLTDGGPLYANDHFACEFWGHKPDGAPRLLQGRPHDGGVSVMTDPRSPRSMLGRWDPWYAGGSGSRHYYGPADTYQIAAEWLRGLSVEDWGCGYARFREFHDGPYVGVDGTRGWAAVIADLRHYRSQTDGLLLRHVLEHNVDWRLILQNAAHSFRRRLALVLFTPDSGGAERQLDFVAAVNVPDLALPFADIERMLGGCVVTRRHVPTATGYQGETVFLVEKQTARG